VVIREMPGDPLEAPLVFAKPHDLIHDVARNNMRVPSAVGVKVSPQTANVVSVEQDDAARRHRMTDAGPTSQVRQPRHRNVENIRALAKGEVADAVIRNVAGPSARKHWRF
jgi:hypothetical protein